MSRSGLRLMLGGQADENVVDSLVYRFSEQSVFLRAQAVQLSANGSGKIAKIDLRGPDGCDGAFSGWFLRCYYMAECAECGQQDKTAELL
jgi:hypothetical protein